MTSVVGVHGVSFRRLIRADMTAAWVQHLEDGLQLALGRPVNPPSMSLVFFDDLVMPEPSAATSPASKGLHPASSLAALDAEELDDFAAAASELLSPEELAEADELPPDKAYTRLPGPFPTLLGALDRRFGPASVVLLISEFKQVRRYLLNAGIKAAVDERVSAGVSAGCRVLLGHSLGSVVAFEFLRQNPSHHLGLFLTVGSPLGLRMVRERMADAAYGSEAPWGVPGNIVHWVNIRDVHDPVACAGDLSRWWPGVIDRHVRNGSDAHSGERYLSQKYAGQAILAALPELGR